MSTPQQIITHLYTRTQLLNTKLDSIRDGPNTKLHFAREMAKDVDKALADLESCLSSTTDRAAELNAIADAVHTMTKDQLVIHIRGLI